MKILGAIFDVDGTLLDSNAIWHTVGERYLRSLGYEPKADLAEVFWDMSLEEAARYYQREYGVKLSVDQIIDGVDATLERFYFEDAQLKPGVKQMLSGFAERGVQMCVATATDRPLIEAALQRCGVLSYFDKILTVGEVRHSKSSPYIFEAALRACGTEKHETPVFEDALYAIVTAKRAGFPIVGIYDRYEKQEAQVRELSDFYVESYPPVLPELLRMAD